MASGFASEAVLTVMSLIVVIVCVLALGVGIFYSVPYALRRIRAHPKPPSGVASARRTFAVFTMIGIVAPTVVVALFLAVGAATLAIEEIMTRSAVVRPLLLVAIAIIAAQVVLAPIGHRHIQELAEKEAREKETAHNKRHDAAAKRESEVREEEHQRRHYEEGT